MGTSNEYDYDRQYDFDSLSGDSPILSQHPSDAKK